MEIDILIEAPEWNAVDLATLAHAACDAVQSDLSLGQVVFSLSILACDDTRIAALNADFRGKPMPTNVLSWPTEDLIPDTPGALPPPPKDPELGDIALAFQTCAREAENAGKPMDHHITHLLVHGLLHCLGYDHENDPDAALMEATETRVLARLGVPDPY